MRSIARAAKAITVVNSLLLVAVVAARNLAAGDTDTAIALALVLLILVPIQFING